MTICSKPFVLFTLCLVVALAAGCVTDADDDGNEPIDRCEGGKTVVRITGAVNDGASRPVSLNTQMCFYSSDGPATPQGATLGIGCSNDKVSCAGDYYCMTDDISSSGCVYFIYSINNNGYPCYKQDVLGNRYKTYAYICVVGPDGRVIPRTERCYDVGVSNGAFELKLELSPDDVEKLGGDRIKGALENAQLKYNGRRSWGMWQSGDLDYTIRGDAESCNTQTGMYELKGSIQFRVF